ncbi:MAG: response regulator transcription factor [Anaerolineae bacterium]|jgi:two-component system NarL family response regulator
MGSIRVLIADDHPVVRRGLESMLAGQEDIEIVGAAQDGQSTLRMARRLQPDVILLDIRMPDTSGLDIARELRQVLPEAKIIVLTTYDQEGYFQSALKAGVHAYLLKDTAHRELARAIRAVHQGQRVIGPTLVGKLWRQFEGADRTLLTEEEVQILRWIAQGATNKQIAQQGFWSEVTVKRKIQVIYEKLGVTRRTEAVAKAVREQFI